LNDGGVSEELKALGEKSIKSIESIKTQLLKKLADGEKARREIKATDLESEMQKLELAGHPLSIVLNKLFRKYIETVPDAHITEIMIEANEAVEELEDALRPAPPSKRNQALRNAAQHLGVWIDDKSALQYDAIKYTELLCAFIQVAVEQLPLDKATGDDLTTLKDLRTEALKLVGDVEATVTKTVLAFSPGTGDRNHLLKSVQEDLTLSPAEKKEKGRTDSYERRLEKLWEEWLKQADDKLESEQEATEDRVAEIEEAAFRDWNSRVKVFVEEELRDALREMEEAKIAKEGKQGESK